MIRDKAREAPATVPAMKDFHRRKSKVGDEDDDEGNEEKEVEIELEDVTETLSRACHISSSSIIFGISVAKFR